MSSAKAYAAASGCVITSATICFSLDSTSKLPEPADSVGRAACLDLGLEEHRLDLRGENGDDSFCDVVLAYLEALLDPGKNPLGKSGIETTASSATTVWKHMTDIQRSALWREAEELHAVIAPLANE